MVLVIIESLGGLIDMNRNDGYINYVRYGNKEGESIVLLHGWGQNI